MCQIMSKSVTEFAFIELKIMNVLEEGEATEAYCSSWRHLLSQHNAACLVRRMRMPIDLVHSALTLNIIDLGVMITLSD